jgi:transcriptional regulator with XRE-family HTH domain
MDREQLADFLRRRREALQPEDVGLRRGARRRTSGLRREEVALLASMSTDYYTRLEQQRGPQPSEPMLAAIARALRLTIVERDHLYRLAGHTPPRTDVRSAHVSPGMLRVLDRLDTPAMVLNDLGETLAQNPLSVALFGDERRFAAGDLRRSRIYRWFTDPDERALHPDDEHNRLSRSYAATLHVAMARRPDDEHARTLVAALSAQSPEFAVHRDRRPPPAARGGRQAIRRHTLRPPLLSRPGDAGPGSSITRRDVAAVGTAQRCLHARTEARRERAPRGVKQQRVTSVGGLQPAGGRRY